MHLAVFVRGAVLLLSCVFASFSAEPGWKAGTAKVVITPKEPLLLAGYAGRDKPATGKTMELWVKVLAIEDSRGQRGVFLTSDLLGIPQSIYTDISMAVNSRFKIDPAHLVLSSSHTHCGPVLRGALYDMYPIDDEMRSVIEAYSIELETNIISAISTALADLVPATLAAGRGSAGFAVNRRNNTEAKVPALIREGALKGPVDHDVPVLAVYLPDGKLKAILFGYACHNTVMAYNLWSGDYAGFAQIALERNHPGTTALFFIGCGADQNPLPRRQVLLAERYGEMLASAVEEALLSPPKKLEPELKARMETLKLDLGPAPTLAELQPLLTGTNATAKRWAARLTAVLKSGNQLARSYPYPIQAWRLGNQLLLTLGGEPVVDYALKFKEKFGAETWVAGYCNDVMTYIPSARVLKEGGYEGGGAMMPYGMPAFRWADDVEDRIGEAAQRLVEADAAPR